MFGVLGTRGQYKGVGVVCRLWLPLRKTSSQVLKPGPWPPEIVSPYGFDVTQTEGTRRRVDGKGMMPGTYLLPCSRLILLKRRERGKEGWEGRKRRGGKEEKKSSTNSEMNGDQTVKSNSGRPR